MTDQQVFKIADKKTMFQERRHGDRRKTESPGYICLGAIGWYCRRKHARRKADRL